MKFTRILTTSVLVGAFALAACAALFLGACTKELDGTEVENQQPTVWFVNVPPEDAKSSVNPIIHWVGNDRDGQIDYFRYIVVRETVVADSIGATGALTAAQIAAFVDTVLSRYNDTLWTYLDIVADGSGSGDPMTSNIIPMEAEIASPVLVFVPQIVFVQAVDEGGLASEIAFRRFLRNDNPPQTRIRTLFLDAVTFIDAPTPQGASTGIRFRWDASDVLDYPSDPPPFEFEWKLFGPYTDEEYATLLDSFEVSVFVTADARLYRFGLDTAHIVCDTSFDTLGGQIVECDTIFIDTITGSGIYGTIDTILRVEDEDFVNSDFCRVADSSNDGYGGSWVTDTQDSLFNIFWNHPSDTSVQMNFLFWIRSRDDAKVPDLTPSYQYFESINPKHERDLLIVNAGKPARINAPHRDTLRNYWNSVAEAWIESRPDGDDIVWDAVDYVRLSDVADDVILRRLLSHKVCILFNDDIEPGGWGAAGGNVIPTGSKFAKVFTALQTGVNLWVTARVPLGAFTGNALAASVNTSPYYQYYFGVEQTYYSGWSAETNQQGRRIDDFNSALSLNPSAWPDIHIDTARLHRMYQWPEGLNMGWDPNLAALPEVDWQVRTFDTEIMYLYGSIYGTDEHRYGYEFSFAGRPVAHRLNRGLFRTAHWLFTPIPFDQDEVMPVVFDMIDWLYDGRYQFDASSGTARINMEGVQNGTTVQEARDRWWDAYERAQGDTEEFYRLLLQ